MTCLFKISSINIIQIVAAGTQADELIAVLQGRPRQSVSHIPVGTDDVASSLPAYAVNTFLFF